MKTVAAIPTQSIGQLSWQLTDVLLLVALGGITLLSRLPFQASLLNNFDAVNYALALDHFDMRLAQPQAPGYPLYILLGRISNLAILALTGSPDSRAALVWISMVFSGLAVAAIYLAGREIFGRQSGIFAALFLGTSTVVWYMGEIAAPYSADLFASAVVGWLCYRMLYTKGSGIVWASAIALGLAGALRLQTLVFLFPLFLYALLGGLTVDPEKEPLKRPWKLILAASVVALAIFGAFFVPAVVASGGPVAFLRSMRRILPLVRDTETLVRSTRWVRFAGNLDTMLRYAYRTLGEPGLPFLLAGFLSQASRFRFWRSPKLRFLSVWLLPSWIVYFLVWPGNLGTMLVSIPPLFLLAGAGMNWMVERVKWGRALSLAALVVLVAWSFVVFALLPKAPFGRAFRQFDNYDSLSQTVEYYRNKLSLVSQLSPGETVVFTDDFRHMQYYLPQYQTYSFPRFEKDNPHVIRSVLAIQGGQMSVAKDAELSELLPPGTRNIVFFSSLPGLALDEPLVMEERTSNGYTIGVVSVPPDGQIHWTKDGLSLDS